MTDYTTQLKEYFTNNRLPGQVANIILRIAGSSQNRFAAGQSKFSRSRIQEICRMTDDAPIGFFVELIKFLSNEENPKLVNLDVVNDLVERAMDYYQEDNENKKHNSSKTNTGNNTMNDKDQRLRDELAKKQLKEKDAENERLRKENAELQSLVNDGRLGEVEQRLSLQSLAHQIDMLRRDMENRILTHHDIIRQDVELKISKAKNGIVALIGKTKDNLNDRINREIRSIEETVNDWGEQTQEEFNRIHAEEQSSSGFDLSSLGSLAQGIAPIIAGLKGGGQEAAMATGLADMPTPPMQSQNVQENFMNSQPQPVSQPDKLYSLQEVIGIATKFGFEITPEQIKDILVENNLIEDDVDVSIIRLTPTHIADLIKQMGFNVSAKQVEMVMANPEILSGFVGSNQFQSKPTSTADQQKPENQAE